MSADTIVPGYANPQSLNRYSYVTNNPLRYTDPTGHFCTEEDADGNIINVNCGTGLPPNGGGGSNSGGGHDDHEDDDDPQPLLDPTIDDCPDWSVCAPDLGPEYIQGYWGYINDFLNSYDTVTSVLGVGGVISSLAGLATYIASNGGPVATPAFLALLTGIAVVEPTPIGEAMLVIGVVATAGAFILNESMNNLQTINNAMVTSGAYSNGGTIITSPIGVQIITSTGTTTVPSLVVGQVALNSWASDNLISPP